jgi:hypothetical protein
MQILFRLLVVLRLRLSERLIGIVRHRVIIRAVLITGEINNIFHFNRYILDPQWLLFQRFLAEGHSQLDGPLPVDLHLTLVLLPALILAHEVQPCVKRDAVVHLLHKWIDSLVIAHHFLKEKLLVLQLLLKVLSFESYLVNFVLGFQLNNLHALVELEVAVLSTHASIQ